MSMTMFFFVCKRRVVSAAGSLTRRRRKELAPDRATRSRMAHAVAAMAAISSRRVLATALSVASSSRRSFRRGGGPPGMEEDSDFHLGLLLAPLAKVEPRATVAAIEQSASRQLPLPTPPFRGMVVLAESTTCGGVLPLRSAESEAAAPAHCALDALMRVGSSRHWRRCV